MACLPQRTGNLDGIVTPCGEQTDPRIFAILKSVFHLETLILSDF
jgi:hypothetical protein